MLYHMSFLKQIFGKSDAVIRQAIYRYGIKTERINRKTYFNIPDYEMKKIRYFVENRKEPKINGKK